MFTQKISMSCTEEQYTKYLKDELLKMGYDISNINWEYSGIIVNNFIIPGYCCSLLESHKDYNSRMYLGSFNAELFLALAAMTNQKYGGYGEWWYILTKGSSNFTCGRLYKALYEVNVAGAFIDNCGGFNGFASMRNEGIFQYIRKATVEEIMEHFKPKEEELIPEKGEYYYCRDKWTDNEYVFISNGVTDYKTNRIVSFCIGSKRLNLDNCPGVTFDDDIKILRLANPEEREILNKALLEQEKYFNPITNTIDSIITTIKYSTPEESAIELLKSKGYIITKQF